MYGDTCRYKHIEEVCSDQSCSVFKCEKRHPKICNFQREFGRCKFTTYCKYSHKKQNDISENSDKIKEIENKLVKFETIAQQNAPLEKNLLKDVEKKLKNMENQIKTMRKALEEKDSNIIKLVKRLEKIEKELTDEKTLNDKETDTRIKDLENLVKKRTKKKVEPLICTACEFTTTSKQGLKTHIRRKHTKLNKEKYPKTCDFCEMILDDAKEMNLHLKTHSYRDEDEL